MADGGQTIFKRNSRLRVFVSTAIGWQGDNVTRGQEARGVGAFSRDIQQRRLGKSKQARMNPHNDWEWSRTWRFAQYSPAAIAVAGDRLNSLNRASVFGD